MYDMILPKCILEISCPKGKGLNIFVILEALLFVRIQCSTCVFQDDSANDEAADKKKARRFDDPGPTNNANNVVPVPEPGQPSPGQLTNDKVGIFGG